MRIIKGRRIQAGSFLELALQVNNWDWDKTVEALKKEYYETNTMIMAKKWGYHSQTIYVTLKRLGVKFIHKGWASKDSMFDRIVKEQGGIQKIIKMHKGKTIKEISSELGISQTYLSRSLARRGYKYDRKKKEWHKNSL